MAAVSTRPKKKEGTAAQREAMIFWICVAPWIIGFIAFQLGPILAALGLSFTRWNILTPPEWIGLRNYEFMFTRDPNFWQSLRVTGFFALFAIPLQIITSLFLAVLLNEATRGVSIFRTIFYLPSVVASVAIAVLWTWIFNPEYGPINGFLGLFGIKGPKWLLDPQSALWALIIMSIWGVGGQMLIFLAGLKGIPKSMYEAAEIDGAGRFGRFFGITLPMLSPTIFFNLVTTMIGSFQTFDSAYIISTARAGSPGSPEKSTLFYMLYTYVTGITEQRMGYALALGIVLFLLTFVATLITLRTQSLWVYNEAEKKK
jgi:multiple sugar transport system permease protein